MLKKTFALIGLLACSISANAANLSISGVIDDATGALAALTPRGTAFTGTLTTGRDHI